jgi:pimeloyl-ACP methyl ester carboxylesterase
VGKSEDPAEGFKPYVVSEGRRETTTIKRRERDHELGLDSDNWGSKLRSPWNEIPEPRHFGRRLLVGGKRGRELAEFIVRVPSAPVYGTNRKRDYSIEFKKRPNMHTVRVLRKPGNSKVTRLFILCNGLNETENLRFYYSLANWIIGEDEGTGENTACVIAPFPGHLMHAPYEGPFSQTPLSRYLSDSGELFRQFLRYMIEMGWLLSVVYGEAPEPWTVGPPTVDSDPDDFSKGLAEEWEQLREASKARLMDPKPDRTLSPEEESEREEDEFRLVGSPIDKDEIGSSVDAMRRVLNQRVGAGRGLPLPTHVVGYSLGGFLAQSMFFAWPNMVSSCATICSGGAIRALSPTAFAHPEEWQAVLHTLRPELEESMLRGRISRDEEKKRIAGMPEGQFYYFQRIFDQVFLQEDDASYKARLSEYGTRMLFISGGEDPIVKTKDVLDASPDEGITMLSIASLTHFLGEDARTKREEEQREHWLPEAGGLIGRAAARAEKLHDSERRDAERAYRAARRGRPAPREDERSSKSPQARDLVSPDFEDALDWVLEGVGDGWLFACRTGLPAAFLGPRMRRAWGTGLHHHDVDVQKYAADLSKRSKDLKKLEDRTTLLLPPRLEKTFVKSNSEFVDPHSDAPGELISERKRQTAWNKFIKDWGTRTRWLDAGSISEEVEAGDGILEQKKRDAFAKAVVGWQGIRSNQLLVTHLPDVWISVNNFKPGELRTDDPTGSMERFVVWVTGLLEEQKGAARRSDGKREKGKKDDKKTPASDLFKTDLRDELVRIVRVSGAELNPRYRGRVERSFDHALVLLAHCAAALVRSTDQPPARDRKKSGTPTAV